MINIKGFLKPLLNAFCALAVITTANANSGAPQSTEIQCTSHFCYLFNADQLQQIDKIIDDQIKEEIAFEDKTDHNSRGSRLLVPIDSKKLGIDDLVSEENLTAESVKINTVTMMSFRYSLDKKTKTYFAANNILEPKALNSNDVQTTVSTIGLGTVMRNGLTVEIGLAKYPSNSKKDLFNPMPQGLFLMLKKRIK